MRERGNIMEEEVRIENGKKLYFRAGFGWVTEGTAKRLDDYKEFMYNPDNSHNCEKCPENRHFSSGLPCGQHSCWVDCHCK